MIHRMCIKMILMSLNYQLKDIDYIGSFTELYDRRIIICSDYKTMKIIKLIEEDKYQIEKF